MTTILDGLVLTLISVGLVCDVAVVVQGYTAPRRDYLMMAVGTFMALVMVLAFQWVIGV